MADQQSYYLDLSKWKWKEMNKKLNLDEIEARVNAAVGVEMADDFIAPALDCLRTDIPLLIAEVRRLQSCERGRFVCDAEIARLETNLRAAREALRIAADRLEGVSIAIEKHGQNITPSFFIVEYSKYAIEARKALSSPVGSDDKGEE